LDNIQNNRHGNTRNYRLPDAAEQFYFCVFICDIEHANQYDQLCQKGGEGRALDAISRYDNMFKPVLSIAPAKNTNMIFFVFLTRIKGCKA